MYYIDDAEVAAVKRVIDKKKLYRYNAANDSECDLFEKEFSQHFECNHSILLSSGTNALYSSLRAYNFQSEDEIIVPVYTFVATALAVVQAGCTPVIANNNEQLGYDLKDLTAKITNKTKAIILVHMDGIASNIEEVKNLCTLKNLILIEDVAQALGGSYKNKRLGTWGHVGCFSLNENKILSCGEGGILITNDREIYEKSFCIHDTASQYNPHKKLMYNTITPFIGSSMRLSEIQGAIMRVQLTRLETILSQLRKRKSILKEKISNHLLKSYCESGDCGTSLHLIFDSQEEAAQKAKVLRDSGFLFAPITTRPAHAAWKWAGLLNQHYESQLFHSSDFISSVEILTRIIKFDIPIELSEQETSYMGSRIREIIC